MQFLLSFITSGAGKWLMILMLAYGGVNFAYNQHRKIVDQEKQIALQQYNINQLQKTVKENQLYIQQMEVINKNKSDNVNELRQKEKALEEKLQQAQDKIKENANAGHDRESSKILKDLFKSLGEIQ